MSDHFEACEGGCTCGHVRYRVISEPMIVHCCHCRWCQRQTGTAFALNALIETDRITLISGDVEEIMTASPSGNGQTIVRCPKCHVAVWSHYHVVGVKKRMSFLRVGSLDNPDLMPPDVHIYTSTKQPWVVLPPDAPAVDEFYNFETTWSADSKKREAALFEAAGITRAR